MVQVMVNGKIAGGASPAAVVVLARGCAGTAYVRLAEAFVETITGYAASTWTDGTGTVTVSATRRRLVAAEQAGETVHVHRHPSGQTLTHAHPGGGEDHGYYEHPEDGHAAPQA